ncbi:hypothetical protein E6C27_scaffold269G002450 [Cucumis melo var. makuwa]|uniref:Uncharacterized protein n=1 Tax=Cucumis melo var. makuwa TaxID=1194695 RepID=A0A5A7SQC6_CUCMM|nr:hypothetical protein E6C27_scaffold269G002450 [Cucumis melo var. makuwa]
MHIRVIPKDTHISLVIPKDAHISLVILKDAHINLVISKDAHISRVIPKDTHMSFVILKDTVPRESGLVQPGKQGGRLGFGDGSTRLCLVQLAAQLDSWFGLVQLVALFDSARGSVRLDLDFRLGYGSAWLRIGACESGDPRSLGAHHSCFAKRCGLDLWVGLAFREQRLKLTKTVQKDGVDSARFCFNAA